MTQEQVETITIDDKVYEVAKLPHEIQAKLKLYDTWNRELHEQKIALSKTELAMNSLSNTMIEDIRKCDLDDLEKQITREE